MSIPVETSKPSSKAYRRTLTIIKREKKEVNVIHMYTDILINIQTHTNYTSKTVQWDIQAISCDYLSDIVIIGFVCRKSVFIVVLGAKLGKKKRRGGSKWY